MESGVVTRYIPRYISNVVQLPGRPYEPAELAMSTSSKPDYDFTPYDGTPGKAWDDFIQRLRNCAAGDVDDRGWSVADHLADTDEGGGAIGAPAMPAAATELRKAQASQ